MSGFFESPQISPAIRVRINPDEDGVAAAGSAANKPIKIVVLSDTHMFRMAKALPPALIEELSQGVDLILHAGDWTAPEVYDLLAPYGPVEGVTGNNDGPAIAERWGERRIVEIGGYAIGLTHGHLGRKGTEANALAAFETDDVDIIVFGHSHIPLSETVVRSRYDRSVRLFNPGSPTDKRRQPKYSYGVIALNGLLSTFEHRYFDSKS